jgi:hypothetical protein
MRQAPEQVGEASFVRLGSSLVPRRIVERVELEPGVVIEVVVAVENGRPMTQSVKVERLEGGPMLTGAELGQLAIEDIVAHAVAGWALPHRGGGKFTPATDDERANIVEDVKRLRRRNVVDDNLLRQVATIYRGALDTGAPTAAVAEALGVGHSTAARYVRIAREPGRAFLPPAQRGKAGA